MTENNLPISNMGTQNPYKQFELTIADGEVFPIYYSFNFFRILSISTSTGVTIRFGDKGTATDVIGAGIGYELPEPVNVATIVNNSGGSLDITVALAIGKIYDDRLNVSGDINVVNAPGTCLEVKNCDDEPELSVTDADVLSMMQNDEDKRSSLTTLVGATISHIENANSQLIPGAANVNGAIIRHVSIAGYGNATEGRILIAGTEFLSMNFNGNTAVMGLTSRDIFIEAGDELRADSDALNININIAWENL